ncbi:MAG: methylmalonyl Co-A mutase-associated GTPase MeaB [Rhodomicrobium sp.]|nr:methylmalonyl Co-A mutase-associated GTPase MeaB [Rhodomicrobium sp.]
MTEQAAISPGALANGVLKGDRAALGRAITLIESTRADHRPFADRLLAALSPKTGAAYRLGVTGLPGVGKSTFIDQLGTNLTAAGHKVAVLAVDPSSGRTGGSILGDKTRMNRLAADPNAFIRPSPSGRTLGGVTRTTRETMLLCEAAGFDVVIVETVGVGQSESAVAGMVDFFLVLLLPGAGDELQGLKKGLIELADLIAINKADGAYAERAGATAADYRAALHILARSESGWQPEVALVSGLENKGLDALWATVERHRETLKASGAFDDKRRAQAVAWMHDLIEDRLRSLIREDAKIRARVAALEDEVRRGQKLPALAADEILSLAGIGPSR